MTLSALTPRPGDILELTVADAAYPGKAVAKKDGLVCFFIGALPGERVRVRIASVRKNFAEADLVSVVESSPHRQVPECPLAFNASCGHNYCPGCRYQHVSYQEEVRLKQLQFRSLLERIGKVTPQAFDEPTASPAPLGYRNKLVLHASTANGGRALGYVREDNSSVLDIPHCPLAVPGINTALAAVRNDRHFMDSLTHEMQLTLRNTPADGTVGFTSERQVFRADDGAISPMATPAEMVMLTEDTPAGPMTVPARSFFQVNAALAKTLMQKVNTLIGSLKPDCLVDLYCGTGIFGLLAAKAGVGRVVGIDSDGPAIRAAAGNAATLGLRNIKFTTGRAERELRGMLAGLPTDRTAVLVDPPRRGLESEILAVLAERKPGNLIYISCAPDTLARDVKTLTEAGYAIESTGLLDMFPRTAHFETVTVLSQVTPSRAG